MESISELHGLEIIDENVNNILSIGISTAGSAEIKMALKNPNCHIVATTIDEEGLEYTRCQIAEHNLESRIELKIEDVSKKMDYSDETFDYVYARLVLHYLDKEQLEDALTEIYRVLKTNGKFFVVVRSTNAWEAKLNGTSYDEKTGMTKMPDIRTYGTDHVKYYHRMLHSEESIREYLEKVGFLVDYTKTYDEYLSIGYDRKDLNNQASELIEVLARKK